MAELTPKDYKQCNAKVDAIINMAREAQNKEYTRLPEIYIPFAKVCVEVAGLRYSKRTERDWTSTFQDWMDAGYQPEDVIHAIHSIHSERKILISRPGTITHRLDAEAALGRSRPENRGQAVQDKVDAFFGSR